MRAAFSGIAHSDHNEHKLVEQLRLDEAYISELSLVAEVDNTLVGYVMLTQARIGEQSALLLAPLAVLPAYQRQGIGRHLLEEAHKRAKQMGYHHILVLGDATYYGSLGYRRAVDFGICLPEGFPEANFLVNHLDTNPIKGSQVYLAKPFGLS